MAFNLSVLELHVLRILASSTLCGEGPGYLSFWGIGCKIIDQEDYERPSDKDLHVRMIRRACRRLRRLGLAEYMQGLFTEDGEVAGSGYGITPAGNSYLENLKK